MIRSHPAVAQRSVRVNIEADSLNSALLLPGEAAGQRGLRPAGASEVAREMTVKSGQKCTAIRRIFVPEALYDAAAEAHRRQAGQDHGGQPAQRGGAHGRAGQPRAAGQRCATAWRSCSGTAADAARRQPRTRWSTPTRPWPAASARRCWARATPRRAPTRVHDIEVFGPVATLMPYRDLAHALALMRRGEGSLVASLVRQPTRPRWPRAALELADSHGRVHVISPDVAAAADRPRQRDAAVAARRPGPRGGGEELGGLRALDFYHRRSAVQASTAVLAALRRLQRLRHEHEETAMTAAIHRACTARRALQLRPAPARRATPRAPPGRLHRRPRHAELRRARRARAPPGRRAAAPPACAARSACCC